MKKMYNPITRNRLLEALSYEPETGVFRWRVTNSPRAMCGAEAGCVASTGYVLIRIDSRLYKAHRLAWLYVTGEWPSRDIDHINGDRADNRFLNLRAVPRLINGQNHRRADRDSRTGVLGVTIREGRYCAQIGVNGKNYYLGLFDTAEQAHEAYVSAKRMLHAGCTL